MIIIHYSSSNLNNLTTEDIIKKYDKYKDGSLKLLSVTKSYIALIKKNISTLSNDKLIDASKNLLQISNSIKLLFTKDILNDSENDIKESLNNINNYIGSLDMITDTSGKYNKIFEAISIHKILDALLYNLPIMITKIIIKLDSTNINKNSSKEEQAKQLETIKNFCDSLFIKDYEYNEYNEYNEYKNESLKLLEIAIQYILSIKKNISTFSNDKVIDTSKNLLQISNSIKLLFTKDILNDSENDIKESLNNINNYIGSLDMITDTSGKYNKIFEGISIHKILDALLYNLPIMITKIIIKLDSTNINKNSLKEEQAKQLETIKNFCDSLKFIKDNKILEPVGQYNIKEYEDYIKNDGKLLESLDKIYTCIDEYSLEYNNSKTRNNENYTNYTNEVISIIYDDSLLLLLDEIHNIINYKFNMYNLKINGDFNNIYDKCKELKNTKEGNSINQRFDYIENLKKIIKLIKNNKSVIFSNVISNKLTKEQENQIYTMRSFVDSMSNKVKKFFNIKKNILLKNYVNGTKSLTNFFTSIVDSAPARNNYITIFMSIDEEVKNKLTEALNKFLLLTKEIHKYFPNDSKVMAIANNIKECLFTLNSLDLRHYDKYVIEQNSKKILILLSQFTKIERGIHDFFKFILNKKLSIKEQENILIIKEFCDSNKFKDNHEIFQFSDLQKSISIEYGIYKFQIDFNLELIQEYFNKNIKKYEALMVEQESILSTHYHENLEKKRILLKENQQRKQEIVDDIINYCLINGNNFNAMFNYIDEIQKTLNTNENISKNTITQTFLQNFNNFHKNIKKANDSITLSENNGMHTNLWEKSLPLDSIKDLLKYIDSIRTNLDKTIPEKNTKTIQENHFKLAEIMKKIFFTELTLHNIYFSHTKKQENKRIKELRKSIEELNNNLNISQDTISLKIKEINELLATNDDYLYIEKNIYDIYQIFFLRDNNSLMLDTLSKIITNINDIMEKNSDTVNKKYILLGFFQINKDNILQLLKFIDENINKKSLYLCYDNSYSKKFIEILDDVSINIDNYEKFKNFFNHISYYHGEIVHAHQFNHFAIIDDNKISDILSFTKILTSLHNKNTGLKIPTVQEFFNHRNLNLMEEVNILFNNLSKIDQTIRNKIINPDSFENLKKIHSSFAKQNSNDITSTINSLYELYTNGNNSLYLQLLNCIAKDLDIISKNNSPKSIKEFFTLNNFPRLLKFFDTLLNNNNFFTNEFNKISMEQNNHEKFTRLLKDLKNTIRTTEIAISPKDNNKIPEKKIQEVLCFTKIFNDVISKKPDIIKNNNINSIGGTTLFTVAALGTLGINSNSNKNDNNDNKQQDNNKPDNNN